jgi:hypothetical protein
MNDDEESRVLAARRLRATADRIDAGEKIGVALAVVNESGAGETLYSGPLGVSLIGSVEILRHRMCAAYADACDACEAMRERDGGEVAK